MHYYGYAGGFSFFSLLWHVLLVIAIIWLIAWIVRMFSGGSRMHRHMQMRGSHSALETLNERFAKGEIDKAEYEERKKALMS